MIKYLSQAFTCFNLIDSPPLFLAHSPSLSLSLSLSVAVLLVARPEIKYILIFSFFMLFLTQIKKIIKIFSNQFGMTA
jgi:hypothetical protein